MEKLTGLNEKSKARFNEKLFHKELGVYVHYDLRNEKQISFTSSSSLSPLFAGIPSKTQGEIMVNMMMEKLEKSLLILTKKVN